MDRIQRAGHHPSEARFSPDVSPAVGACPAHAGERTPSADAYICLRSGLRPASSQLSILILLNLARQVLAQAPLSTLCGRSPSQLSC